MTERRWPQDYYVGPYVQVRDDWRDTLAPSREPVVHEFDGPDDPRIAELFGDEFAAGILADSRLQPQQIEAVTIKVVLP